MNANNTITTRRKFSAQFKDQVLARVESDGVAQVARDLELKPSVLYAWQAQKRKTQTSFEAQKLKDAEHARIKRENAELRLENDFLKKVAAYFSKE